MMKYVYQITGSGSAHAGGKKLRLLANMLLWFLAGTASALVFAATVGKEMRITAANIAEVGSVASLTGGYIGGVIRMVNREE